MTKLEKIANEALALEPQNRAELAELLIQSLDEQESPEIKAAWMAEVRRRDEEIRSGKAVTKSAEEVLRDVRERIRCSH